MFVFVALAIVAFSFITMHLWNWLMPDIFGLPIITWAQAVGLIVLSKIFFGFGKGKKCCGHDHDGSGSLAWKEKMRDRYENMSDEEKERFKNKCGRWMNIGGDC